MSNTFEADTPTDSNSCSSKGLDYPDLSLSSFASQSEPSSLSQGTTESSHVKGDAPVKNVDHTKLEEEIVSSQPVLEGRPFCSPLGFHIPPQRMNTALCAPENSEVSYWQHSLYRGPGGDQHVVKIHYCKTRDAMESVSELFANERVLGFDIEWMANSNAKHGTRRNVSLIQVASEERVALFHIARFAGDDSPGALVAPTFKQIMENPDITKVGVAILGDSTRLKNYLDIRCRGLCELSFLHKLIKYHNGDAVQVNRYSVSLAQQVEEHLGLPLLKNEVQTSDWSRELDYDQTRYAASDPYACLQLFFRLEAKRLALKPVPPRPADAELKHRLVFSKPRVPTANDEDSEGSDESFVTCIEPSSDEDVDYLADEISLIDLANLEIAPEGRRSDETRTPLNSADLPNPEGTNFSKTSQLPKSEIDIANQWATAYQRDQTQRSSVPISNLRAYHLWHHQHFDVPKIARLLREPPLKYVTVLEYICEAVYRASLPADPRRFGDIGTHGVQPYKRYHQDMLKAAVAEMEHRKDAEADESQSVKNVGWWKKERQPTNPV